MNRRWLGYATVVLVAIMAVALFAFSSGLIAPALGDGYDPSEPDDYEHTTVTVIDAETDTELGHVEAAIADTFSKRYIGLSATEHLPADRGMLFIHDSPGEYTYVMRDMSFGLDIVFIDSDGTITWIHEAPPPGPDSDGADQTYTGEGQYILEVNEGWMAERGVEHGDRIVFER